MNWRNFSLVVALSLVSGVCFAQSNLLNAKTPQEIGKKTEAQLKSDNDKPLPYGYVHDRDVLMAKMVWEFIDLDERINFPMYFPVEGNLGPDRKSLYAVLVDNMKSGKITEVYDDSYFTTKKSLKDIETSLSKIDTADAGREQYNAGEKISEEYIVKTDITPANVMGYKIKGYWYFDKRQGELKYRLQGICPVVPDVYTMGTEEEDPIELFWVYFPAVRDVLHEAKAFNDKNSALPITFDHLLNSRRFNGVIYQEENVMGDRKIEEYMKDNAQMQLLESERIKDKIRNFEQDMWNY
ncbi:MAG: gliding motility protein GldN [Flavobacterium lindanitolerans]|jgi:gliding motility associated protien GldN|uniref:type IX secretion system ring protein PorN/GldN n=1 Tax=Flavobacterium lindanitolerans TaxID=428988 RepID=UPI001A3AFDEB|nr:gliding motility protein GldN [Flavobacterium lindanitolerans]MBL7867125.1 gliding motility protein GldN [Flavobacterium lindanitolerans]